MQAAQAVAEVQSRWGCETTSAGHVVRIIKYLKSNFMELTVIQGGRGWDDPFEPLSFSLALQPQRPGEICESVHIEWPSGTLESARAMAAVVRLPVELLLTITIESERVLTLATVALAVERESVVAAANEAASGQSVPAIRPRAARRLAAYGSALRTGDPGFAEPEKSAAVLRVSHTVLVGWSLAAAAASESLEDWIASLELASGRHLWEAAAAESGRQLEGWLFVQAARVARSRST
jgi:hypothetical protein